VRGGDHFHVDRDASRSTDATNAALLEDAKQLALERRGQQSDLVEKERSANRNFE
jgi:hypothetical protein